MPRADGVDVTVAGVDGGGTKTHAIVADASGNVLGFGAAGPGNWEGVGLDGARDAIGAAVGAALEAAGIDAARITASAFALAGCDWPSDQERLRPVLDACALHGPRLLVNDAFGVLRAGLTRSHGIASVAGTGGSTCGRNRAGAMFRTLALSWGEGTGASGIVRDALHALAHEHHAQSEPSALAPAILAELGFATVPELFEALSRGGRHGVSGALAPTVLRVAAEGDACARAIVADAGRQHGHDVVGVARRLGMVDVECEVVRAGGVHRAGDATFDIAFCDTVLAAMPGAAFVPLAAPPVVGAALLALEAAGLPREAVDAVHPALSQAATDAF